MPAWLATMVQVPAATSVSVVPLTVQVLGVVELKVTARPELALAASGGGGVPRVWLPGEAKVMVCDAFATVMTRDTVTAAAKMLLPAWLASMMQVPAATSVSVVPLAEQVLGVVEAKLTGRPELELATNAAGALPSVWLPGEAKVMVCAAAEIVKTRDTVAAAA